MLLSLDKVELEIDGEEPPAPSLAKASVSTASAADVNQCVTMVEVLNSLGNNVRAGRVPLFVCLSENYQSDSVLDQIIRFSHLTFQVSVSLCCARESTAFQTFTLSAVFVALLTHMTCCFP